jgi:hypothetical protein
MKRKGVKKKNVREESKKGKSVENSKRNKPKEN